MPSVFFRELQLITVLFLICVYYMSFLYKLCVGFSIFDSVSFLLKFLFLLNKMHSLTLIRYNSFQNQNNRKVAHSFAPRRLVFKMQQQVLKFNGICVSCSSPKLTW